MCGVLHRDLSDSLIQGSQLTQCRSWRRSSLIRLLSVCLMLEFAVHRTGIWERKVGVQWGRTQTGSHSETDGKLCQFCCLWPWLCGYPERAGPFVMEVTTHTWPRRQRLSGSLGEGRVVVAASHHWSRWGVQWVQAADVLPDVCPFTCSLRLLHSSLSCGPPNLETNGSGNLGECDLA